MTGPYTSKALLDDLRDAAGNGSELAARAAVALEAANQAIASRDRQIDALEQLLDFTERAISDVVEAQTAKMVALRSNRH